LRGKIINLFEKEENTSSVSNDNSIVYGRNVVLELLKSGKVPDTVYIADFDEKGVIPQIIARSKEMGVIVKQASMAKLDLISEGGSHQGVAALVSIVDYVSVDDIIQIAYKKNEQPFLIIADEIEDPHNLGALIRTADAAGAHGLIIPKRRSANINSTVYKTSAGACAHLAIAKVSNIADTIEQIKKKNIWVYGTDMEGQPLWRTDLKGAVALVIGSEGKGIGQLVKKRCDVMVSIPMNGKINSLNASVAGGIIMYEIVRQRVSLNK
jgi:23S rRNA (guanosine2251-2'-O)-methyltransferase